MVEKKKIELGPRNDPLGLSQRALINLHIIEESFAAKGEGHVITQLVQSLLALIVFPRERKLDESLKRWKLGDLANDPQWPIIKPALDEYQIQTESLYEVLGHMRNAVCHGRVVFFGKGDASPDSRYFNDVLIECSDENRKGHRWRLGLEAGDVKKFCLLLSKVIYG